jgi:hypothetical protein
VIPEPAATVVGRFVATLDRALPGVVGGFYVVGSIALGAFRPGRSDIDFVATLPRPLSPAEIRALRAVHRRSCADAAVRLITTPPRTWPLVCNGVFVRPEDLAAPPGLVAPVASQVAGRFDVGSGFDLNPVTWWTLAHRGIAVRGPAPGRLAVHLDDARLRAWTAANLVAYWRPWADALVRGGPAGWYTRRQQHSTRRAAAWGVFGVARMHATIRTGTVIGKEQAGEYALGVFDAGWHPVIRDALAYWRGLPPVANRSSRAVRTETGAFVSHVVGLVGAR